MLTLRIWWLYVGHKLAVGVGKADVGVNEDVGAVVVDVLGEVVGEFKGDDVEEDGGTIVVVRLVVVMRLALVVVGIATEGDDDALVEVLTSEELSVIVVDITVVDDWTIDLFNYQSQVYFK